MIELPVNSDGARHVTINTGLDVLTFRTYYSVGESPCWLLDIIDSDGNELLTGVTLVPGSDNLLKGQGDTLEGYQLYALLDANSPGDPEALGKYLLLILYNPGEQNLYQNPDPMNNITWKTDL